ncbi:MAG: ABC transporter permease [Leptolyngbyaceae cyanobacterium bins.59]|nr:ABC transporter permease [Leptolyngbyaceae cyanobacterium bins.59]
MKRGVQLVYRVALGATVNPPRQHSPYIRIQASQGWESLHLWEIWEYRDLIFFLFWSDLKSRYTQMALGPLWIVIQPLFTVVTSTIIFGVLAKLPSDGLPYPLFNYTALLPWGFFTASVSRASGSLLGYHYLISKVYFPRLILPILSVIAGLPDLGISLLVLLGIAGFYGFFPSARLLLIPFFLLLAAATAVAIGLWLAALLVRFRDMGALLGYFLQAWMYATPIVYPISMVPQSWRFAYHLNPMTTVVTGFRWCFLGTGEFLVFPAILSIGSVMIILILGAYFYRSAERSIVDII